MHIDREPQLELVGCPECGAPAEIIDRFTLESTNGPVAHTKIRLSQSAVQRVVRHGHCGGICILKDGLGGSGRARLSYQRIPHPMQ